MGPAQIRGSSQTGRGALEEIRGPAQNGNPPHPQLAAGTLSPALGQAWLWQPRGAEVQRKSPLIGVSHRALGSEDTSELGKIGGNTRPDRDGDWTPEDRDGDRTPEDRDGDRTPEDRDGDRTPEDRDGDQTPEDRDGDRTPEDRDGDWTTKWFSGPGRGRDHRGQKC
ncbi:unnamed protein product [Gadus morhua 'NCC']